MSDLIGVLGSSATPDLGTNIAYTVPAGKAAKVKLMYRGVAGVNSVLTITVNGIIILVTAALTSGNVSHSTTALMHNTQAANAIDGSADSKVVAPGPKEYYLSEGDNVSFTIGTAAFSAMNFQVVGTEIDIS